MKKLLLPLAAVLLSVSLTACGGDTPDDPAKTSVETVDYRGETLSCLRDGRGTTRAFACNFEAFYTEHPALLTDTEEITDVWWTTLDGEPLGCYHAGNGKSQVMSCDFVWFYATQS